MKEDSHLMGGNKKVTGKYKLAYQIFRSITTIVKFIC